MKTLLATILFLSALAFHPAAGIAQEHAASAPTEKADADTVKHKVNEAITSIRSYSVAKREEAAKEAKTALDDFDARLEQLEKQIADKKAQWSKKTAKQKEEQLGELKKSRAEAATRYENLKKASGKAWEVAKEAFLKSYKKLEKKLGTLKSEVTSKETHATSS